MKKITKSSLDELAKIMPVVSHEEECHILGGGTGGSDDPYTVEEYERMLASGTWNGGFVSDWGYSAAEVTVTPGKNPKYDHFANADSGGTCSQAYEAGYNEGYSGVSTWKLIWTGIVGSNPGGDSGISGGPEWDMYYYHFGLRKGNSDRKAHWDNYFQ
ncbi:MAG: hypothetical protein LBN24_04270 [Mediterranea sp.]|jgi:hypothetical protein|nr:hypothetical protein [Mediterranea sp.]